MGILFLYRACKTESRIESNKLDEPFPNFIVNQENYITQTCLRPTLSFANFRDAVRMIVQCSVFSVQCSVFSVQCSVFSVCCAGIG